jgi:ATP-dependent exoDNAse (exonuclease V) beta subunit
LSLENTGGTTANHAADQPTIRGILDLLLLDPVQESAEIFDYKTDSPKFWRSRLADYQRQMSHYLRAASDILGYRVPRATLIFLSPRQEVTVEI